MRYWGKCSRHEQPPERHPLLFHCLDVGAVGHLWCRRHPAAIRYWSKRCHIAITDLIALVTFCLIFHDVGKLLLRFQNMASDLLIPELRRAHARYGHRHDAVGLTGIQYHLASILPLVFREVDRQSSWLLKLLLQTTACHHGKPTLAIGNETWFHQELLSDDPFATMAEVLATAAAAISGLPISTPADPKSNKASWHAFTWWLNGLCVLSDWVGSQSEWFPYTDRDLSPTRYWRNHALPQADRAVHNAGLSIHQPTPVTDIHDLFPDIDQPRPMQTQAEQLDLPGGEQLLIIEDVPGSGKTEAALVLAGKLMGQGLADGIYMALPTMATANAMYDRISACYQRLYQEGDRPSAILSTGSKNMHDRFVASILRPDSSVHPDDGAAACTAWLADSNKRGLLADVAVGTIDQALMATLPVKHQSLRLFGLHRKVLIVDEVHACDDYVFTLLIKVLRYHAACGGSAVLLSATLPQRMRTDLVNAWHDGRGEQVMPEAAPDYPLLTQSCGLGQRSMVTACATGCRRTYHIQRFDTIDSIIDRLCQQTAVGGCACWIRNTVDDSITAWHMLRERLPADCPEPMIFHARSALGDRLDREQAVLDIFGKQSRASHRRGRVLIATQVIEQSIDADFDLLISDLAPIDRIIQRLGRCQRHTRDADGNPSPEATQDGRPPPTLLLHSADPEQIAAFAAWLKADGRGTAAVYRHHGRLWHTASLLAERGMINMPQDARSLVDTVYDQLEWPSDLQQAQDSAIGEDAAHRCLAHGNALKLEQSFPAHAHSPWGDDAFTPTRLGEATRRIRLARWNGETLQPWYPHPRHSWELSEVNLRAALIAQADAPDTACASALTALQQHHSHALLVALTADDQGRWQATISNARGEPATLSVDPVAGVQISHQSSPAR